MKRVILLQRVEHLGEMGEEVTVRPGYARNFLIPKGLAVPATEGARKRYAYLARRAEAARKEAEVRARERAERLAGAAVVVRARANEEGHLYGSVTATDIAEALAAQGHEVERREIETDGPIRTLGVRTARIHLETGIRVPVRVEVVPIEEGTVASAPDGTSRGGSRRRAD